MYRDVAVVNQAVEFLSLQLSPKQGGRVFEVVNQFERKDRYSEIVAAGFDITKNAEWLQNYYLEKVRQ